MIIFVIIFKIFNNFFKIFNIFFKILIIFLKFFYNFLSSFIYLIILKNIVFVNFVITLKIIYFKTDQESRIELKDSKEKD